ncbi:MAG: GNAT family N-acetyltransferase [Thermoactinospora sp.]|nr:GNAT family N-acetyltransferase [Thermoactinospora sp.]
MKRSRRSRRSSVTLSKAKSMPRDYRPVGMPVDSVKYGASVEIGFPWYGRAYWRTAVNTACKIRLVDHAFDAHDYNRVVLKTDHLNTRSQQAIARLGAVGGRR